MTALREILSKLRRLENPNLGRAKSRYDAVRGQKSKEESIRKPGGGGSEDGGRRECPNGKLAVVVVTSQAYMRDSEEAGTTEVQVRVILKLRGRESAADDSLETSSRSVVRSTED